MYRYTDTTPRFNGHFPGEPGLVGTRMSILVFVGAKDDGSAGDNWGYKTFKASHVTINKPTTSFYRPDVLPVAQPTVSEH